MRNLCEVVWFAGLDHVFFLRHYHIWVSLLICRGSIHVMCMFHDVTKVRTKGIAFYCLLILLWHILMLLLLHLEFQ